MIRAPGWEDAKRGEDKCSSLLTACLYHNDTNHELIIFLNIFFQTFWDKVSYLSYMFLVYVVTHFSNSLLLFPFSPLLCCLLFINPPPLSLSLSLSLSLFSHHRISNCTSGIYKFSRAKCVKASRWHEYSCENLKIDRNSYIYIYIYAQIYVYM